MESWVHLYKVLFYDNEENARALVREYLGEKPAGGYLNDNTSDCKVIAFHSLGLLWTTLLPHPLPPIPRQRHPYTTRHYPADDSSVPTVRTNSIGRASLEYLGLNYSTPFFELCDPSYSIVVLPSGFTCQVRSTDTDGDILYSS